MWIRVMKAGGSEIGLNLANVLMIEKQMPGRVVIHALPQFGGGNPDPILIDAEYEEPMVAIERLQRTELRHG